MCWHQAGGDRAGARQTCAGGASNAHSAVQTTRTLTASTGCGVSWGGGRTLRSVLSSRCLLEAGSSSVALCPTMSLSLKHTQLLPDTT